MPHKKAFSRVFNSYKNSLHDRQIGARRVANQAERHVCGPSKDLPIGCMITGISVPPGSRVVGAVTDRKDFYHQAKVTQQRAATNVLPFKYPLSDFAGSEAERCLLAGGSSSRDW